MAMTLNQAVDEVVPEGMHLIMKMDDTGESRLIWDPSDPTDVAAARDMFNKFTKEGRRAYSVGSDGERTAAVRTFDATAEKLIFAPALVGG